MVTGALIMGATSLGGALIQSNAASSAAQAQTNAQLQALALANQNLQPGLQRAYGMAGTIQPTLTGLLTPGTAATTLSQLPGYQWGLSQTMDAAKNYATTMGLGGNAAYGLGKAVSGFTANNYFFPYLSAEQNAWNAAMQSASNFAGTLTGATGAALGSIGNAQANAALTSGAAFGGALSNTGLIGALAASGKLGTGTPVLSSAAGLFGGQGPQFAPTDAELATA